MMMMMMIGKTLHQTFDCGSSLVIFLFTFSSPDGRL